MTSTLQPPRAPESRPGASAPRRAPGLAGRLAPGLRIWQVGAVIGLLLGGLIMLVVAALGDMAGIRVPVLSSLAEAPAGDNPRLIAPRTPPPSTPGTCLTWRRPDAADAETVDCAQPHLFEQAGAVELADLSGPDLPDNQRFRQLVNERCTPLVTSYLGNKYDPSGAFRAGALKPSAKRWSDGDRSLRCGLQRFSRSGVLYPISGTVAGQDQADVRPAGTCLGIDGRFIGDPVDCAQPHAVESVGWIDLGDKFKGKFPEVNSQDEFLQPACSKLAGDYAGGAKVISDKKLSVLWDNLTKESWAAGTRKVACNLAAQLPDKSGFAAVTGSVKGQVAIADRPAPPARPVAPPGAPAHQGPAEPGPPLDFPAEVPADDAPGAGGPMDLPAPADRMPNKDDEDPGPIKLPDDQLPKDHLPKDLPKDGLPKDLLPSNPVVPSNPLGG